MKVDDKFREERTFGGEVQLKKERLGPDRVAHSRLSAITSHTVGSYKRL